MKKLIILPFAEIDIKDTVSYYKALSDELDKDFINNIDSSFKEILKNPEAFPIEKYDIRKFVIDKFPFCIYYIDNIDTLYVLAIFHDKRNPKDWTKRRLKRKSK
jgi:plasmid stabilization system protein ParE